jgi:two-component system, OmpR family, response regulator
MSPASRVMIVEDEAELRLALRAALISDQHILTTTDDAEVALRHLRREPADLLLLGPGMPDRDGLGLLRRLRAEGIGDPAVIITAPGGVLDPGALRLGAVAFLAAPVTPEGIRTVVRAMLARRAGLCGSGARGSLDGDRER